MCLQNEEAALRAARTRAGDGAAGAVGTPAWNHAEFVVRYPSLDKHLAVGGVYLNLLLDGADQVNILQLFPATKRENLNYECRKEPVCWRNVMQTR